MTRNIEKIIFDAKTDEITIIDNVETWKTRGSWTEMCPRLIDRYTGYVDRIRKVWDDEHKDEALLTKQEGQDETRHEGKCQMLLGLETRYR